MAMLAEARRKQKISADPRGNAWRNDENKFGQKLMEKMGWSEGKGLGAKEDGNVNHVTVSLRPDKRGVGCSKSHADDWIAHQDDFSALLAQLNENHKTEKVTTTAEDNVIKMEEKSRTAKGRVHYQKFTKGKDLSRRSETDLDCVFGKRKSQSGTNTPDVQASSDEADESTEPTHGVKTIRSTDSIQEYFAKKMAEKKNRAAGNTGASNTTQDIETPCAIDSIDPASGEETKKKKKKSKKEKKELQELEETVDGDMLNETSEKISFVLGCEDSESEVVEKKEKKSKKKKQKKREKEGIDNLNNVQVESVVTVSEENCKSEKKEKKLKKNKRKYKTALETEDNCDNDLEKQESVEETASRSKKAKKQKKKERNLE